MALVTILSKQCSIALSLRQSVRGSAPARKALVRVVAERCLISGIAMPCRESRTTSANVIKRGKSLIVGFEEGDTTYHPTWLRHNCQCSSCFSESNCQKTIHLSEITPSLTLESAHITGIEVCEGTVGELGQAGRHFFNLPIAFSTYIGVPAKSYSFAVK